MSPQKQATKAKNCILQIELQQAKVCLDFLISKIIILVIKVISKGLLIKNFLSVGMKQFLRANVIVSILLLEEGVPSGVKQIKKKLLLKINQKTKIVWIF